MFMNPDLATQLARQQQRQMLTEASHHQRDQHGGMAPRTPGAATRIIRRLAAAITSAGVPSAQAPGTIRTARGRLVSEPAAVPGQTPDSGH